MNRWTEPLDENPWFLEAVANYVKKNYPEAISVEIHVGDDPDGRNCIARIVLKDDRLS